MRLETHCAVRLVLWFGRTFADVVDNVLKKDIKSMAGKFSERERSVS
jgi:hypothetical protein